MKRTTTFIISVVIIICVILLTKYFEYKDKHKEILNYNSKYELYKDKEIKGIDLASIINKAIDDDENAFVKKDDKGKYIQDDERSVNIKIKITDLSEDKIYDMETLSNRGIDDFVKYYGQILFECTDIDYNSVGKVKYMLFKQVN